MAVKMEREREKRERERERERERVSYVCVCVCVQLWCAVGVNVDGWQQSGSTEPSSADVIPPAAESDDSPSAVCEHNAVSHHRVSNCLPVAFVVPVFFLFIF